MSDETRSKLKARKSSRTSRDWIDPVYVTFNNERVRIESTIYVLRDMLLTFMKAIRPTSCKSPIITPSPTNCCPQLTTMKLERHSRRF